MTSPHDALFKAIFSDPDAAEGELRAILPLAIAARIDFSTLHLEPGSFVDEELRSRHSDLLFSATVAGREARLYLLFEHRSTPDPWLAFRLLIYEVRIWEAALASDPSRQKLPAIVPVVVHHGPIGWTAACEFSELLDLDDFERELFAPLLPRFAFVIDDLAVRSPDEIMGRVLPNAAKLALMALRDVRDAMDIRTWLRTMAELIRALMAEPQGFRAFATIIRYIFLTRSRTDVEGLAAEAERIALGAGAPVMTTARQLIEQGIEQGLEQGIQRGVERGVRATLVRQLTLRFGPPSELIRARIDGATSAELERWTDRVLTATSIEDVVT